MSFYFYLYKSLFWLTRDPSLYKLPELWLNPLIMDIDDFTYDDIKIEGYQSYPRIVGEIAV